MQITSATLGAINNGLTLAFNSQLYEAASVYKQFTYDASSTGAAEVYPSLALMRGIREWVGPRVAQSLGQQQFTIPNRKFEQTISIARTDIEDDKYGMYGVVAGEMGATAARFPDLLVAQLMQSGTSTKTIDGQNFFDTSHPTFTSTGGATTIANYASGSSPGWYLVDNSRMLKPFIFQNRIPFGLVTRFNPDDPNVFDNDEFLWGTRGRCNAGFGLWQLAYYSTQPMTMVNLIAARTAMATIRRPDGTPMGITPDTLVVPSTLFPRAQAFYRNTLIANDPTSPTTLVENDIINMFKPVELKWLN